MVATQPLQGPFAVQDGIGSFIAGVQVQGAPQRTLTAKGASMNIISLLLGAGVISLPAAIGKAGIITGFGFIVFSGVVAIDSGRILCDAASAAQEIGYDVKCYEDIGFAALGSFGRNLVIFMMQLMQFTTASIFILLAGLYLGLIIDTAAHVNESNCEGSFPLAMNLNGSTCGGWMLVATLLLVPTLFMWDMSTVARFAPIAIAGAVCICVCLCAGSLVYMLQHGAGSRSDILLGPPNMNAMIGVFMKTIFAYGGVACVPAMREEMVDKERLKSAVVFSLTCVMMVYLTVCVPTIIAFGQPSTELLAELHPGFLYVGSAALVVHVFIVLPLSLNVFFKTASLTVLPVLKTCNIVSLLVRFAVLAVAFAIPMVFAKFGPLVDLTSAIVGTSTMIFFPIIFRMAILKKKEGSMHAAIRARRLVTLAWEGVLIVIGIIAAVQGVKGGLLELAQKTRCPLP